MPRYAAQRDANQSEITKDLEKLGYSVQDLSKVGDDFPDIIVGFPINIGSMTIRVNILFEIKVTGGVLSEGQTTFFNTWKGAKYLIFSTDDAFKCIERHIKELVKSIGMV